MRPHAEVGQWTRRAANQRTFLKPASSHTHALDKPCRRGSRITLFYSDSDDFDQCVARRLLLRVATGPSRCCCARLQTRANQLDRALRMQLECASNTQLKCHSDRQNGFGGLTNRASHSSFSCSGAPVRWAGMKRESGSAGKKNAGSVRSCPRNCKRRALLKVATEPSRLGKAEKAYDPRARRPA
jgi:hypothetical protein